MQLRWLLNGDLMQYDSDTPGMRPGITTATHSYLYYHPHQESTDVDGTSSDSVMIPVVSETDENRTVQCDKIKKYNLLGQALNTHHVIALHQETFRYGS
jgi:hypothetical protein